jgi:hypothetical protein
MKSGLSIAMISALFASMLPVAYADGDLEAAAGGGQYNVVDYGAIGDDAVDDTIAIQNAIEDASRNGGGTVYVPAGLYLVADLRLRSNIALVGSGWDAVLKQNSTAPGIHYVVSINPGSEGVANPKSNIQIRNIKLMDKNGEGVGFLEHQHVLNINAASDVTIDNVHIAGFRGDGIYVGSSNTAGVEVHNSRISIRNSYFDGVTKDNRNGVSLIDCEDCTIENNEFVRTTRPNMPGAIDLEPNQNFSVMRNITIRNNSFDDIGGNVGMIGLVLHHSQSAMRVPSENIIIENNRGQNLTSSSRAITMLQRGNTEQVRPNGIVIRNNRVTNSRTGAVGLFGVKGVTVENNHFSDLQLPSFIGFAGLPAWDITLQNNTFHNIGTATGEGVNIFSTKRLRLENNVFMDIGLENGTKGYALNFIPASSTSPGTGSSIAIVNNKIISHGRTTYAIKNSGYVFTEPASHTFDNNKFVKVSGNDFPYEIQE